MDTMQALLTRRSIRKFEEKKVSKDLIEKVLKAGMYAPSAYNQQPWQFIVIDDKNLLLEITKFHPYAQMCRHAPHAILICADLSLEQSKDMWILDCSACTQNILLALHELNLGGVWVSIYFREDRVKGFQKMLNLPENIIPISLVPFGYPAEQKPEIDRFKKDRIHYNSF